MKRKGPESNAVIEEQVFKAKLEEAANLKAAQKKQILLDSFYQQGVEYAEEGISNEVACIEGAEENLAFYRGYIERMDELKYSEGQTTLRRG